MKPPSTPDLDPPITEHAIVRRKVVPRKRFVPPQAPPIGKVEQIYAWGQARVRWESGMARTTEVSLKRLVLVVPASACTCGCQQRLR